MKALKYYGAWNLTLKEVERPRIETSRDVIVKIKYTGICGTDLGILSGYYPVAVPGVTLGHESVGYVDEIGSDVTEFSIGDAVVINPTYYCGKCRMCRTLRINHCEHKFGTESGVSRDGTYAEYYRTTADFLIKIPSGVSMKAAALTEPLSCTLTGVNKIHNLTVNISSIVFGAGPMGLLYAWALTLRGLFPKVIEISPDRRRFAGGCLPLGTKLYGSLEEADRDCEDGKVFRDLVVDTTSEMLEKIYPEMECGGIFVSVGLKETGMKINARELADKSLTILGSIDSSHSSFSEAFYLIEKGIIPTESMVSHTIPIEDYVSAFRLPGYDMEKNAFTGNTGETGKILIEF